MNSRKTTRIVETITRQLKGSYLKSPPPSYLPILSHPPAPSLVRFLSPRPNSDLPPSSLNNGKFTEEAKKFNQLKAKKLNNHTKGSLTKLESNYLKSPKSSPSPSSSSAQLTRRPRPRISNSRNNKPQPIVFPEDEIRKQFYRDHPFEAFKPIDLVESESIQLERLPIGKNWTDLSQRTVIPTAEDAISFTLNLHEHHNLPLSTAYATSIQQFRSLSAHHENSLRSATMEAKAHGAIFFTEIERGLRIEEKVLDEWKLGREVQSRINSMRPGGVVNNTTSSGSSSGTDLSFLNGGNKNVAQVVDSEEMVEKVEFTGGVNYVERFQEMMDQFEDEIVSTREAEGVVAVEAAAVEEVVVIKEGEAPLV